jgi:hypothetical protein
VPAPEPAEVDDLGAPLTRRHVADGGGAPGRLPSQRRVTPHDQLAEHDRPEDDEKEGGETGDPPADQRDPAATGHQLDPGNGLFVERRRHQAMVGVNPSRTLKPR